MSFSNVYYKRTTATAKACYVCYKPTTTVLATMGTTDFLYTCVGHLSDRGFATMLEGEDGARKTGLTDEEIANVKEEWEEKQRRKKEKEKEEKTKGKEKEDEKEEKAKGKEDEKEDKVKEKEGEKDKGKDTPSRPVHERYALQRNFFDTRQREYRKRRQMAQAKDLAPRLPGAPKGKVN